VAMNLPVASVNAAQQPSFNPWVLPARALTVFYGCPEIPRLSHYFLPRVLRKEGRVLYLDGANQISPLLIARLARERGRESADFNRLIRISRAFTCFQLTELIERTPRFLKIFPAEVLMVTALPGLYFDEDVREREVRAAFERALEALRHPVLQLLSVAVFSDATSMQSSRKTFFRRLIAQAEHVVQVAPQPDHTLAFTSTKARPQVSS
jgi:hypothetical protein